MQGSRISGFLAFCHVTIDSQVRVAHECGLALKESREHLVVFCRGLSERGGWGGGGNESTVPGAVVPSTEWREQ